MTNLSTKRGLNQLKIIIEISLTERAALCGSLTALCSVCVCVCCGVPSVGPARDKLGGNCYMSLVAIRAPPVK